MRTRTLVIMAVLGAAVIGLVGYLAGHQIDGGLTHPLGARLCTAEADGEVDLDSEQMGNAATIAAVGLRRRIPDHGIVVALATALQESKLRNLDHMGEDNDHDSVGLFQQRPSQGWGSAGQIQDPRYAANRFYSALNKVKGWQKMRVTDAAQQVQRSAYPEAYQKWADEAKILMTVLTGQKSGGLSCSAFVTQTTQTNAGELMRLDFGSIADVTQSEDGKLSLPVAKARTGWQYAHWLIAQSEHIGVSKVVYAGRQWTSADGRWTTAAAADESLVLAQVHK